MRRLSTVAAAARLAVAYGEHCAVASHDDCEAPTSHAHPSVAGRVGLDVGRVGDDRADRVVTDAIGGCTSARALAHTQGGRAVRVGEVGNHLRVRLERRDIGGELGLDLRDGALVHGRSLEGECESRSHVRPCLRPRFRYGGGVTVPGRIMHRSTWGATPTCAGAASR